MEELQAAFMQDRMNENISAVPPTVVDRLQHESDWNVQASATLLKQVAPSFPVLDSRTKTNVLMCLYHLRPQQLDDELCKSLIQAAKSDRSDWVRTTVRMIEPYLLQKSRLNSNLKRHSQWFVECIETCKTTNFCNSDPFERYDTLLKSLMHPDVMQQDAHSSKIYSNKSHFRIKRPLISLETLRLREAANLPPTQATPRSVRRTRSSGYSGSTISSFLHKPGSTGSRQRTAHAACSGRVTERTNLISGSMRNRILQSNKAPSSVRTLSLEDLTERRKQQAEASKVKSSRAGRQRQTSQGQLKPSTKQEQQDHDKDITLPTNSSSLKLNEAPTASSTGTPVISQSQNQEVCTLSNKNSNSETLQSEVKDKKQELQSLQQQSQQNMPVQLPEIFSGPDEQPNKVSKTKQKQKSATTKKPTRQSNKNTQQQPVQKQPVKTSQPKQSKKQKEEERQPSKKHKSAATTKTEEMPQRQNEQQDKLRQNPRENLSSHNRTSDNQSTDSNSRTYQHISSEAQVVHPLFNMTGSPMWNQNPGVIPMNWRQSLPLPVRTADPQSFRKEQTELPIQQQQATINLYDPSVMRFYKPTTSDGAAYNMPQSHPSALQHMSPAKSLYSASLSPDYARLLQQQQLLEQRRQLQQQMLYQAQLQHAHQLQHQQMHYHAQQQQHLQQSQVTHHGSSSPANQPEFGGIHLLLKAAEQQDINQK
eukprot:gene608-3918_t